MITAEQLVKRLTERKKTTTLEVLGSELGVSAQAVHQWLTGKTKPSKLVLIIAAQKLR